MDGASDRWRPIHQLVDEGVTDIGDLGPCSHVTGTRRSLTLALSRSTLSFDGLARDTNVHPCDSGGAERVAKEVEGLAEGIPNRGLRLVESEPQLGHHLLRLRQSHSRRARLVPQ